jgi:hypothetical protein
MNITYMVRAATAAVTLAAILTAGAASAQSNITTTVQAKLAAGVAKLQSSCGDEIKNFCSTVTPGEGREVLCIEAHEDKLSPKCLFDLHAAAKNLKISSDAFKEATAACHGDVAKLCGQTPAGQGRLLQCLMTNKGSVSQACADSLKKLADFAGN